MISICLTILLFANVFSNVQGDTINFLTSGGIPLKPDIATANHNTLVLNNLLSKINPGDVLVIPEFVFHINGGIVASHLKDFTFQLDGELSFINDRESWPHNADETVINSIVFTNFTRVLFTSVSQTGVFNGNGKSNTLFFSQFNMMSDQ